MKFKIGLGGKTIITAMRECGYAPAFVPLRGTTARKPDEFAFQRFLGRRRYPRFHAYCQLAADGKTAILNLHLDQKQPSYNGSHAHSGEYDGPLVEQEAARIRSFTQVPGPQAEPRL